MFFLIIILSYILLSLFLYEYYIGYFMLMAILLFLYMKSNWFLWIKDLLLALVLIFLSPFLFEYFDHEIFETYLFFDLNYFYYFVGGEVTYILSLLHCFIFFLGYNRKKYL